MPWRRTGPMKEKVHFISDYLRGKCSMSELCLAYGISRKTGYKWINRFNSKGLEGLRDQTKRPHITPHRTPERIKREVICLRKRYGWGAKKLLPLMQDKYPDWDLPGQTTLYKILKKEGLVNKPRRRRRIPSMSRPFASIDCPNAVWTVDFKGQFRTGNGKYCYPLTVKDAYSRYLFDCRGLSGISSDGSKKVLSRLFEEYGLPDRIRSDNGVPFASVSASGLSRLSLWWIKLGILPERIEVGKPQQNGRHERMHRTLKESTAKPPASNMREQQSRFDHFRKEYNEIRPHEALNFKTPASIYTNSLRPMPSKLPHLEYPGHYVVRYINQNGCFFWNNQQVYLGYLLRENHVGLEEINYRVWDVYIGSFMLGSFYEDKLKVLFTTKNIKKV
jgi:transposase InsO family protein